MSQGNNKKKASRLYGRHGQEPSVRSEKGIKYIREKASVVKKYQYDLE